MNFNRNVTPYRFNISAIVSSSLGKPPISCGKNTRAPPVTPKRIGRRPKILLICLRLQGLQILALYKEKFEII